MSYRIEDILELPKRSADPTGVESYQYYNTATKKVRVYNGTAWEDLLTGTGGVAAHSSTHSPGGADPLVLTGINIADVYANRPAASTALNGVRFWATDKWMEWQCVAAAWVLLRAEAQPWTSTTLPTSPVDGQRISWALTTTGPRWLFRYNSGSGNSAKWEAEGRCEPKTVTVGANQNPATSGAWVDMTTTGPDVVVPFTGDYLCCYGALITHSTAAQGAYMGIANASVSGTPIISVYSQAASVTHEYQISYDDPTVITVSAAQTLRARYFVTIGGQTYFQGRFLSVRPLRIGP